MTPKKPALCGVTYIMRCKKPHGHPGPCKFVGPHRYGDAEREEALTKRGASRRPKKAATSSK